MSRSLDRLYDLLPTIYRQRDAEQGLPLRALLRVISEQVNVVEDDIAQLYDNLFIETCQDWVVPYIGDLIGYQPILDPSTSDPSTLGGQQLTRISIPRREVANTIPYRRRKGTLALLELLAGDVAGWPARAVELYKLVAFTQAINHLRLSRGRTVDQRHGDALDRLDGPFDEIAHTVDIRRITSHRTRGRYNLPSIGLFVWRLRPYAVTRAPAHLLEEVGSNLYTFSALGNDAVLFSRPEPESGPEHIAEEWNVPGPIRRYAFAANVSRFYGEGKSLQIWVGRADPPESGEIVIEPVPASRIVPADLSGWHYRPPAGYVAVDVALGRIAFPPRHAPQAGVWVTYHYGFSADLGGGEYERPMLQHPALATHLFRADDLRDAAALALRLATSMDAVSRYLRDQASPGTVQRLIEYAEAGGSVPEPLVRALLADLNRRLTDEALYDKERFVGVSLSEEILRLLASSPQGDARIRLNRLLLEAAYPGLFAMSFRLYRVGWGEALRRIQDALNLWRTEQPRHAIIEITDSGVYIEPIGIDLGPGQSLVLRAAQRTRPVIWLLDYEGARPDGLRIRGQAGSEITLDGLLITGRAVRVTGDIEAVTIRHSTLVPGWGLLCDCTPRQPAVRSLELVDLSGRVIIDHSIVGSIQVIQDEVGSDPFPMHVCDSIIDATSEERDAVSGPGGSLAHLRLRIERTTVFGRIMVHAIELASNSIFEGLICVARRQVGCMRFCSYIKGSRTPRRYRCQPDLAERAIEAALRAAEVPPTEAEIEAAKQRERERVRPRFSSRRYGTPAYGRLAPDCAEEIARGADDQSEMGAFHDLYEPQRNANLRARLAEYTPADMEVDIIYVT